MQDGGYSPSPSSQKTKDKKGKKDDKNKDKVGPNYFLVNISKGEKKNKITKG